MEHQLLKNPFLKSKNYCPNPIVKNGIPAYADASRNKKVLDTLAYQQFWEEQIYYIHNGYTTGGVHIPGRYYKFINFDRTQTVKGAGPLEVHDYQLDYALWIEDLKRRRKNSFIPKARRKAVSVMNIGMNVDYGFRFALDYHAAVVAGLDEYSQDFMDKWRYVDKNMQREFKLRRTDNADELIAGWQEMEETGWELKGTQNTVYVRTVNNNANVLKGKFLHDIIAEESGENELLLEMIQASEDCLKLGGVQFGTFHLYGTGGNMNKGSKGFKHIHNNLKAYNAEEWYIPAQVFYFPCYAGATDENGVVVEDIPNLQKYKPHERVGMSDTARALELIKLKKEELLELGDMDKYYEFCRNTPTDVKEIFRKTSSNNFDINKLNEQLFKIESGDVRYHSYILDYKKTSTGETVMPLQVEIRPASQTDNKDECVYILNDGHPMPGYMWLDCAGIDSYDQDQAKESKSLGAMCVFRRNHNNSEMPDWLPVAVIRTRPKHKELFYEMCCKLAVYYNLIEGVLIDIGAGLIIKHFQDAGLERFLSRRPRKFESPNTKQTHDFGVSLNTYSKPKMIGALQSYFLFHSEKVWFDALLNESLDYGETEKDSDNDLVDAFGIALMKALDMEQIPEFEDEGKIANAFDYPEYGVDGENNIVVKNNPEFLSDKPLGVEEDWFSRHSRRLLSDTDNDNLPSDSLFNY